MIAADTADIIDPLSPALRREHMADWQPPGAGRTGRRRHVGALGNVRDPR